MKNGSEDIKRHKWYKSIEWEQVVQKKLPPPIIPKVNHDGDTKNFDRYDEDGWRDVPTMYVFSIDTITRIIKTIG